MNKIILLSLTFLGIVNSQTHSEVIQNKKLLKNIDGKEIHKENIKKIPKEIVLSLFNNYFIPIKAKNSAENEELFVSAIKEIINKYFDITKIVNTVLGPNKSQFTQLEKQEFSTLLIKKMSIVYGKQFSEFEDIKNFEITDIKNSERARDNKKCSIVTSSVSMKGEKIELLWFFLENNDHEMKIIDIKVAGISLTQNWKEQIRSLILQHKEVRKFLDNF